MNLRQAKYMVTIYKEGQISLAAKKLFISQSALSQIVQNIEKELGATLFKRTTPITLTSAGIIYIKTVQKMLMLEEGMEREMEEITVECSGTLRIGFPTTYAKIFLPTLFPLYRKNFPNVNLEIIRDGSASMPGHINAGDVDMAFMASNKAAPEELHSIVLRTEKILLFAAPTTKLARRIKSHTPIKIMEAKDEEFVTLNPGHGLRALQDNIFADKGISPKILINVDDCLLAVQLAAKSNAVVLFPDTFLNSELENSPLFPYYPLEDERYLRKYYLCWSKDLYVPNYMYGFIELVKSIFPENNECTPQHKKPNSLI